VSSSVIERRFQPKLTANDPRKYELEKKEKKYPDSVHVLAQLTENTTHLQHVLDGLTKNTLFIDDERPLYDSQER